MSRDFSPARLQALAQAVKPHERQQLLDAMDGKTDEQVRKLQSTAGKRTLRNMKDSLTTRRSMSPNSTTLPPYLKERRRSFSSDVAAPSEYRVESDVESDANVSVASASHRSSRRRCRETPEQSLTDLRRHGMGVPSTPQQAADQVLQSWAANKLDLVNSLRGSRLPRSKSSISDGERSQSNTGHRSVRSVG